jgi:hypothetical protein
MDSARPRRTVGLAPTVYWSVGAGGYALFCSLLVLAPLSSVTRVLVQLLPGPELPPLFALPVPVLGAVVRWAVVERRGSDGYLGCALAGALTGLLTVLCWILAFVIVWSAPVVGVGGILIAFVLAVVVPAGAVAALPLTALRRRARQSASASA